VQITRTITHDDRHSQAASFTQARTHACVLARQLQDSQGDIKELLAEVADWQKVASDTTAQLQLRDAQVKPCPAGLYLSAMPSLQHVVFHP